MKKNWKTLSLMLLLPAVFVSGVYATPLASTLCQSSFNQICVFVVNFPKNQNVTVTNPIKTVVSQNRTIQSLSVIVNDTDAACRNTCMYDVTGWNTVSIYIRSDFPFAFNPQMWGFGINGQLNCVNPTNPAGSSSADCTNGSGYYLYRGTMTTVQIQGEVIWFTPIRCNPDPTICSNPRSYVYLYLQR